MNISTDNRNTPVEHSESTGMQSITPAPNQTVHSSSDSVSDHGATQRPGAHSPTDGGRETTGSKVPGYAEIEEMVSTRLADDPEYQELKAKLDALKSAEIDFALVDAHTLGKDDGVIDMAALRALAGDEWADAGARAAAQRFLNNPSLWNELASGASGNNDNRVGVGDIGRLIGATKDAMSAKRTDARNEIRTEVGAATAAANGAAPAGAAASGGSGGASGADGASQLFKPPTPSTKPGMEGAVENINNTLSSIGDAMGDLSAKLMNPDLSPAERQKLQAAYNQLQQLQSMLMEMFKQLQEAIANMIKMYSDVAKNSIQNMR